MYRFTYPMKGYGLHPEYWSYLFPMYVVIWGTYLGKDNEVRRCGCFLISLSGILARCPADSPTEEVSSVMTWG